MIRQGRLFGSFLLLLVLTACGQGRSGWNSFPIPIYSDQNLVASSSEQSDLKDAMDFWEAKAGHKLFDYKGVWSDGFPYTGSADSPGQITGNVVFFQNPWPFDSRIVGRTTVHTNDNQIESGMVMLNPAVSFCSGDCAGEYNKTSRRKTLAHELGHFLGLGHVEDQNNIMYPQTVPGASLNSVQVDQQSLATLVGSGS